MNTLPAGELLTLWENGRTRHPIDRALLLLGASQPEQTYDQLADWPVGRRDAAILSLRLANFGMTIEACLDCPSCRTCLEVAFDGRAFEIPAENEPIVEAADGWFRLPTGRDLATIVGEPNPDVAVRRLLSLCWLGWDGDGDATMPEWSQAMLQEVEARMGEVDPQSIIELDFVCDACGHAWQSPFDICEFVWEEIEARAKRLLQEVHLLAGAYGWSERDVLAMTDVRRSAYVELVGA
jgi:hypothetical protein